MNPWITAQVVYLSIYLLAVYTRIVTGAEYRINGTQKHAKVHATAEPGVDIRTVIAYNKNTGERATSYQLSMAQPTYFVINKDTGTISTVRKIDKPVNSTFFLTVYAKFPFKFTLDRQLVVDVVQKNTVGPRFQSKQVTFIIDQRAKIGTLVGRLSATDQSLEEYNRRLTYFLEMKHEPKTFGVENGDLRVIRPIPVKHDMINFTAFVSDNGYPPKKAWQMVSVKISNIPALTKFCSVKDGLNWRICWKYEPPSSQHYVYRVEVRQGDYTHNNSVVGGTEHCYNTSQLDGAVGKYFYRVQTRLGNNKSPFSEWKEAVDKGPDCETFKPCFVLHKPCNNGGSCHNKDNHHSDLEDRYTCNCPYGWHGTRCQTRDLCAHTTCLNQGTCIMVTSSQSRCDCPDGYLGEFCEFANPCSAQPCLHGATCQLRQNASYECKCPPLYTGPNCENLHPCHSSKCVHGTCIPIDETVSQCKCDKGYTGQYCEHYSPCILSNPCENNGTCVPSSDTPAKYICQCTEKYIGVNCSKLDACKFINCENGGTCSLNEKAGQHCKCPPGFIGGECQRMDKCYHQQPCKNGATCHMKDDDSLLCHCTNGFIGDHCELIDPCANGPCNSKTSNDCIRISDTKYRCSCNKGYTGDICETVISSCLDNLCRNNGTCIESDNDIGYKCHCRPGFYGVHCDEMDPCRNHNCKNGATCRGLNDGTFRCHCPAGFSGTSCETLTFCSSSTCMNGGNCSNGERPSDTICSCPPDYYGQQCEFFNFCSPEYKPCLNGGKCEIYDTLSPNLGSKQYDMQAFWKNIKRREKGRDRKPLVHNKYRCVCLEGYSGEFCETFAKDDGCHTKDGCANGGTCQSSGFCLCPSNYTGKYCEHPLNACYSEPCLNGGSCTDQPSDNGFTCSCMPFFQGDHCEFNMSTCQDGNPCDDRSDCVDTEYGYRCDCKPQFSGINCTIKASCNEDMQKDDTGRYVWPETFYGRTAIISCNYAKTASANASRPCIFNTNLGKAQWGRVDTSQCEKIGEEEASKVMKGLRSMTDNPQSLTAEQIANVTERIEEIFSYSLKNEEIADNMVGVFSNMLDANTTVMDTSNKRNKTNERLTQLLEDFTANVSIPVSTGVLHLSSPNLILMAHSITGTSERLGKHLNLNPVFENNKKKKIEFAIPWKVLTESNSVPDRIQVVAYTNAKLYMGQNQSGMDINDQSVISVKVKGRELKNLTHPVTYTVSNIELNKNHTCVYWDTINRDWSTEGIVTRSSSFNETFCESNHLTSFSLLLDPSDDAISETHEMILTYISYIGCGISLFGIVLTIITYGLFGCLHGDPSGRILLNLCSSLLFLNVAFLMASQVTTHEEKYNHTSAETLCIIVTILIHYFLLTTLAWMCVEAINMYQMLVTVFNIYHSRFMLKRVLAAWGIPALTVGITLGVDIRNYQTPLESCFLSQGNKTAFYVSLLTPACIILFINTVVFGMVTKVIMKPKFKNKHQCTSTITSVQVRGCFTVMVLLGVTWLFGPLAINEMKIVFNYLFCILNSLQGFFIFVFRCLLNPEAKMAWVQLIKMGTLKKKKGPRKSVDSSSNGMYGGGGGGNGGGGGGMLGQRWSQKTMTVEIRDNTNLQKFSKPNENGIYEKNVSYKSCGSDWDHRNGSTYQSDRSKPVEFTRL